MHPGHGRRMLPESTGGCQLCLRAIIAGVPREYPEFPIPSVGVLVVKDRRALLVQRGQEPSAGRWTIPGGVIEAGETIHEAGRRELLEECGIDVEVGRHLQTFEVIVRDDHERVRYHYIIFDLLGSYRSGELTHADDIVDSRWFALDDLPHFDVIPDVAILVRRVLDGEPDAANDEPWAVRSDA